MCFICNLQSLISAIGCCNVYHPSHRHFPNSCPLCTLFLLYSLYWLYQWFPSSWLCFLMLCYKLPYKGYRLCWLVLAAYICGWDWHELECIHLCDSFSLAQSMPSIPWVTLCCKKVTKLWKYLYSLSWIFCPHLHGSWVAHEWSITCPVTTLQTLIMSYRHVGPSLVLFLAHTHFTFITLGNALSTIAHYPNYLIRITLAHSPLPCSYHICYTLCPDLTIYKLCSR